VKNIETWLLFQTNFTWLYCNASQKIYKENKFRFTVQLAQQVHLGSDENWEVGICEISYPLPIDGTVKPVLIVGVINLLVYCNWISQQFLCDDTFRCLRNFILPSSHCQHVFKEVFYVFVQQQSFQEIRIECLTLEVKRFPFKDSKTPSKVVLDFRKNFLLWYFIKHFFNTIIKYF
jgi:hypothetical protein